MLRTLRFGLLAGLAAVPCSSAPWRIEAIPLEAAETTLRRSFTAEPASGRVPALLEVSRLYPHTTASGLARLAAGLELLDEERPQDALPQLAHEDVARTGLRDHALLATGRAQEALEQLEAAARSFLAAAREPASAVGCRALPRAAETLSQTKQLDAAAAALAETIARCPEEAPRALLDLSEVQLARGDRAAAAVALDRLDRDHPTSAAALEAQPRLRALATHIPPAPPAEREQRRLRKGEALLQAGQTREAIATLRKVQLRSLSDDEADLARLLLGRGLLDIRRSTEARDILRHIGLASPQAAEAAWHLARDEARRRRSVVPYEAVALSYPGTPWAEEALLAAGNHYQKDALDGEALPWYQRLLAEYPNGRHVERVAWRVGWWDYRAKRFQAAAQTFERMARSRPPSSFTPSFLYWAGRARLALAQPERARRLLTETVRRYKHQYHGLRAREVLAQLEGPSDSPPTLAPERSPDEEPSPTQTARVRQLLLIDRFQEAADELRSMGDSRRVRSTLAWVEWRRGRFLEAIVTMKRAHPEWAGEGGDRLPDEVWRIMYPLCYEEELRRQAAEEGLDASLVAALILQESSFDPEARSRAGARGLMQVMPATGSRIARAKGLRFRRAALHDPRTSLDFGTHYLRQMSDRFDGAVEKVLAAYNAGPHRVAKWTALSPGLSAEDFIESIPFTETRQYVMLVLANREHYRRLYRLHEPTLRAAKEGPRP